MVYKPGLEISEYQGTDFYIYFMVIASHCHSI